MYSRLFIRKRLVRCFADTLFYCLLIPTAFVVTSMRTGVAAGLEDWLHASLESTALGVGCTPWAGASMTAHRVALAQAQAALARQHAPLQIQTHTVINHDTAAGEPRLTVSQHVQLDAAALMHGVRIVHQGTVQMDGDVQYCIVLEADSVRSPREEQPN